MIDHALRFLESSVASIYGDLKLIVAVGDAGDHVKIILKGENGRLVDLEISGGVTIGSATYRVSGPRGSLELSGSEIKLKYLSGDPRGVTFPHQDGGGHGSHAGHLNLKERNRLLRKRDFYAHSHRKEPVANG